MSKSKKALMNIALASTMFGSYRSWYDTGSLIDKTSVQGSSIYIPRRHKKKGWQK